MQRNALEYARRDGLLAEDELFYAQQNAQTVRNAEVYYRAMFGGRVTSWNLRDQHMAQTLQALADTPGPPRQTNSPLESSCGPTILTSGTRGRPKWAADGQLTLGQLARERYGEDCAIDRIHDLHRHGDSRQRMGRHSRAQGRQTGSERQRRRAVP